MPTQKNDVSGKNMITRFCNCVPLALLSLFSLFRTAWGGGLWLYEGGTPDLGRQALGGQPWPMMLQPPAKIRRA
jgi:hypothetical protein